MKSNANILAIPILTDKPFPKWVWLFRNNESKITRNANQNALVIENHCTCLHKAQSFQFLRVFLDFLDFRVFLDFLVLLQFQGAFVDGLGGGTLVGSNSHNFCVVRSSGSVGILFLFLWSWIPICSNLIGRGGVAILL